MQIASTTAQTQQTSNKTDQDLKILQSDIEVIEQQLKERMNEIETEMES